MRDYQKNLQHNNGKYVCHRCSVQLKHNKSLLERQLYYYKKLEEKCREHNYKLLSDITEIKNNTSFIKYACPIHGEHRMRISNFLNNRKCPQCNMDRKRKIYQLSLEEVNAKVKSCNGTLINPEDYVNVATNNLLFICEKCGSVFKSSLAHFTQHGGRVCGKCNGKESLGEIRIKQYLKQNDIDFIQQKWFSDCRDQKPLPFDYYIPALNTIIEFDGRQHFVDSKYFSYGLEQTRKHDEIKNTYCADHDIKLIRIPYTKINKISTILSQQLFT